MHLKSERHTKSTNSFEPKQPDIRGLLEPQTPARFDQQFCKSQFTTRLLIISIKKILIYDTIICKDKYHTVNFKKFQHCFSLHYINNKIFIRNTKLNKYLICFNLNLHCELNLITTFL